MVKRRPAFTYYNKINFQLLQSWTSTSEALCASRVRVVMSSSLTFLIKCRQMGKCQWRHAMEVQKNKNVHKFAAERILADITFSASNRKEEELVHGQNLARSYLNNWGKLIWRRLNLDKEEVFAPNLSNETYGELIGVGTCSLLAQGCTRCTRRMWHYWEGVLGGSSRALSP